MLYEIASIPARIQMDVHCPSGHVTIDWRVLTYSFAQMNEIIAIVDVKWCLNL